MCTSAIKKICRRHGIARWPHRKIASVEKSIQTIQHRIRELEVAPAQVGRVGQGIKVARVYARQASGFNTAFFAPITQFRDRR